MPGANESLVEPYSENNPALPDGVMLPPEVRLSVSVTVEREVIEPGETAYLQDAWELKERIRRQEGVLKQRRGFFTDAYRRSTVHAYVTAEEQLIGFAAVRRDGYILFLAVAPEFRGDGYAKRLVAAVAEEHSSVTCHARTTNTDALEFYEHVGFERVRRVTSYYEDGGDAFYLRLGEGDLKSKLSRFVGL
jgi:ribosomal protein S18 acetylase RimI-like enzyme